MGYEILTLDDSKFMRYNFSDVFENFLELEKTINATTGKNTK